MHETHALAYTFKASSLADLYVVAHYMHAYNI